MLAARILGEVYVKREYETSLSVELLTEINETLGNMSVVFSVCTVWATVCKTVRPMSMSVSMSVSIAIFSVAEIVKLLPSP